MVPYLDDLLGKWTDGKNRTTPTTPTTLPPTKPYDGLTSTIFVRFWWNLVWKSLLEGYAWNEPMVGLGQFSDHLNHPINLLKNHPDSKLRQFWSNFDSLCQHVNIGITSRRDPLNNEITPCRDITSRRDPLILRITLLSGSRRDVISHPDVIH